VAGADHDDVTHSAGHRIRDAVSRVGDQRSTPMIA
jgi:hypothetical protein